MKLANIVYEKELVNHVKVDFINYFNESLEYEKLDQSLPTLYVGWSFMKTSNPNNEIIQHADILKKKIITNQLYWECSFDESKSSHVKGIEGFVNSVPQLYFPSKYQYINLDPVFFQIVDIEGLLDVLHKEIDVIYNYKNEMLYVRRDNRIWGINLKMYEFFKFDVEQIKIKIEERTKKIHSEDGKVFSDLDGSLYLNQYKIFPNFSHLKRYMVVALTK